MTPDPYGLQHQGSIVSTEEADRHPSAASGDPIIKHEPDRINNVGEGTAASPDHVSIVDGYSWHCTDRPSQDPFGDESGAGIKYKSMEWW